MRVIDGLYIRGSIQDWVRPSDLEGTGIRRVYALHGPGQPMLRGWSGYRHFPMSDGRRIPDNAHDVADLVVKDVLSGRPVVVLCLQGRNRSGLVVALALRSIMSVSGAEAARMVREVRPRALSNPAFSRHLEALP